MTDLVPPPNFEDIPELIEELQLSESQEQPRATGSPSNGGRASKQFRNWCFTINILDHEDQDLWREAMKNNRMLKGDNPKIKYLVWEFETGDALERPHVQGYLEYQTKTTLTGLKKLFNLPYMHAEARMGTASEAATYCKKEGSFFEFGRISEDRLIRGRANGGNHVKHDWEEMLSAIKGGIEMTDFIEKYPKYSMTSTSAFLKLYAIYEAKKEVPTLDGELKDYNIWIYGEAGTGKSRYAFETFGAYYSKQPSKWWDGYKGEETVVLDDLDPESTKYIIRYLKIWSDRYPFEAEIKGGTMKIRPRRFVITSNYSLEECIANFTDIAPLRRRFKVMEFTMTERREILEAPRPLARCSNFY